MEQLLPEVLALVVADQVYHDDVSGKLFVLGVRSVIGAQEFPFNHPYFSAYVAMVDGRGETPIRVRLIDADEEREAVFEDETVVNFPNPLTEIQLIFTFTELVFPKPGEYRLQLYVAGQFMRERRLVILPLESSNLS